MLVERTGISSGEFEVLKRREHLALEGLIMKVQGGGRSLEGGRVWASRVLLRGV